MSKPHLTAAILLGYLGLIFFIAPTARMSAAETPAIYDALAARAQAFADAWNKHDPQAMAALWTADGDLINPFGRLAAGQMEIQKLFSDEHGAMLKTSRFELKTISTRMLTETVGILDADVLINGAAAADGTALPTMSHHVVMVMQKGPDGWRFTAVRAFGYQPHLK